MEPIDSNKNNVARNDYRNKLLFEIRSYIEKGYLGTISSTESIQELEYELILIKSWYHTHLRNQIQNYINLNYIDSIYEREFLTDSNLSIDKLEQILEYYVKRKISVEKEIVGLKNIYRMVRIGTSMIEQKIPIPDPIEQLFVMTDLFSLDDRFWYNFCYGTKQYKHHHSL